MIRLGAFGMAMALLVATPASAASDFAGEYLCQDEFASGLIYPDATRHWQSAAFRPPAIKFILRLYGTPLPPNSMGDIFYLAEILDGDGKHPNTCSGDADRGAVEVSATSHIISCSDGPATYWLNLDLLRFSEASPYGFINGEDSPQGQFPYLLSGICSWHTDPPQ